MPMMQFSTYELRKTHELHEYCICMQNYKDEYESRVYILNRLTVEFKMDKDTPLTFIIESNRECEETKYGTDVSLVSINDEAHKITISKHITKKDMKRLAPYKDFFQDFFCIKHLIDKLKKQIATQKILLKNKAVDPKLYFKETSKIKKIPKSAALRLYTTKFEQSSSFDDDVKLIVYKEDLLIFLSNKFLDIISELVIDPLFK